MRFVGAFLLNSLEPFFNFFKVFATNLRLGCDKFATKFYMAVLINPYMIIIY